MSINRFNVPIPEKTKKALEQMSDETGISMSQLAVMALHSLVVNYQTKGTFIFADLLNPDHKVKEPRKPRATKPKADKKETTKKA